MTNVLPYRLVGLSVACTRFAQRDSKGVRLDMSRCLTIREVGDMWGWVRLGKNG